ncbi:MAG: phytanoyl-CoA dioxygenase family protein [Planktomarina sp.]
MSYWIEQTAGDVDAFKTLVSTETKAADYPLAASIQKSIPIYDGGLVRDMARTPQQAHALKSEFIRSFGHGPGIIVIKNGLNKPDVIDRATEVFEQMIDAQNAAGAATGDHFAKPGSNDRVWNAAEKHCVADPANFAAYYACDGIALPSAAWLGAGYQITAQVNRVNPGGTAQTAHRDYHLGFMSSVQAAKYPAHIHALSPALTLQGAIVHRDMPIESGPTMLLPYSQLCAEGYLAFERPEFQQVFAGHHVQLPMEKGDLLFFNPAVMHGAGNNTTRDIYRFGNLLQVGSGFGRSIETVDRTKMSVALYPELVKGQMDAHDLDLVIAASAEGYPFPTNLDLDPPVGGMAPMSQADRLRQALTDGMTAADFAGMMERYDARRRS